MAHSTIKFTKAGYTNINAAPINVLIWM